MRMISSGWEAEEGQSRRPGLKRHSAQGPKRNGCKLSASRHGCGLYDHDLMFVHLFLIISYERISLGPVPGIKYSGPRRTQYGRMLTVYNIYDAWTILASSFLRVLRRSRRWQIVFAPKSHFYKVSNVAHDGLF